MDIEQLPVALLVGGLAVRLRPLTDTVPKALLEVAGLPFVDHQLGQLRASGIRRVVVCLGHLGEQVQRHLGDGSTYGLELQYSYDGPRLMGTGGALRRAAPLLGEIFGVLYGDSYPDLGWRSVLADILARDAAALMTVFRNDNRWDRSNVLFRDGRVLRYEKRNPPPEMVHIDFGVSLLRREALDCIPPDIPYDLADLWQALAERGQLAAYEVARRFYEIGSSEGLAETRAHLEAQARRRAHISGYLSEAARVLAGLDVVAIDGIVAMLAELRLRAGRLFVLGVGGCAASAAHAVNDFRKLCAIEAYAPTDNVPELTARTNDEGWETVFEGWLRVSRLSARDMILVLSVGGGDLERSISPNIVRALQLAREVGASICGVVGRNGGYTASVADACVLVPMVSADAVTPHTEAVQAMVCHLLSSHPALQTARAKWESVIGAGTACE